MQKDDVRMQQHWHAVCECGNAGTPPCKSLAEKKACASTSTRSMEGGVER